MVFEESSVEAVFAENLREARTERGMTQAEVAEAMAERGFRWHPPTVYKVENGERQIQLGEALELARILGRSVEDMARSDENAALRRANIALLHMDVVSAAAGIVKERSSYLPAVRKLRVALEETPDLAELFPDPDDLESMRWHINSDFAKGVEKLVYDPPITFEIKDGPF